MSALHCLAYRRSTAVTLTAALPASGLPPSTRQRAAGPPSPHAPTAPPRRASPEYPSSGQVGNQGDHRPLDQLAAHE